MGEVVGKKSVTIVEFGGRKLRIMASIGRQQSKTVKLPSQLI